MPRSFSITKTYFLCKNGILEQRIGCALVSVLQRHKTNRRRIHTVLNTSKVQNTIRSNFDFMRLKTVFLCMPVGLNLVNRLKKLYFINTTLNFVRIYHPPSWKKCGNVSVGDFETEDFVLKQNNHQSFEHQREKTLVLNPAHLLVINSRGV